ncbi:hypothetical protein V6N11_018290 [Hibiscus sabdariffa]|uniref:Uncharacterized protein n=1 Tax=Hibiscus sabdariffa TaxID=183260 RepID=A0ABR2T7C2_9ROSI
MEHHGPICPTPRMADVLESSTTQKSTEHGPAVREVAPLPTATHVNTTRRKGKTPAGRIMLSDHSSSPEVAEQPPAKRQMRYHVITADSDDDSVGASLPALAAELFPKSNQFLVLTYWLQDAKV